MRTPAATSRTGLRAAGCGGRCLAAGAILGAAVATAFAAAPEPSVPVTLQWLGGTAPAAGDGVSFGVPWPKGAVHLRDALVLKSDAGAEVPVQTWPLAYWPDGSLKWTGHAVSANAAVAGATSFQLAPGPGATAGPAQNRTQSRQRSTGERIAWNMTGSDIDLDTGRVRVHILKHGSANLFEWMRVGEREVARSGRLEVLNETRPEPGLTRRETFVSRVDKVTLEQAGPVRAVVKFEGTHVGETSGRELLPFVVRLYFYAGLDAVRVVHSFVFDGDAAQDFIAGLGLTFAVPFVEPVYNRHVRLGGDTGMWGEPVQPLVGRREVRLGDTADIFPDQLAAKPLPPVAEFAAADQQYLHDAADWGEFRLSQLNPNGFTIAKRTSPESSWLHVLDGGRSLGLAYLGDVRGGVAVGLKDFWQKHPSSFAIADATGDAGRMTVWLWSPEAAPMDLRHYDTEAHGLAWGYEDIEPGFSTPYGIANTHELTLWAVGGVPSGADLVAMAQAAAAPALLVCTPEYLHAQQAFGFWSLPDRSTPARARIEDQQDAALAFFIPEREQRHWDGMWNYGDFQRRFDDVRHEWRYDIGGWAWNNTELMPDLWLWFSFLRSGRADVFRAAEAMTRHTQETDVYHLGRFAGLGSRHNVSHWGDGAKQVRISHAALKNIYYYLTTDERTGDLLHEVVNADFAHAAVDPLRNVRPASRYPVRAGLTFETTWLSFAINWMTEWERTRDPRWRDKILTGMKSMLDHAPPGSRLLVEGGYDPATGMLYDEGGATGDNIAQLFGGPEIAAQLVQMIDYPEFWDAWTDMCTRNSGRLLAYAAHVRNDAGLGRRVWGGGGRGGEGAGGGFPTATTVVDGPDYPNAWRIVAGEPESGDLNRLLSLIECLDLAGPWMPRE